jgi:catechol 2,3-dioxygenase-like lactoylglutathione lyase family enzyme
MDINLTGRGKIMSAKGEADTAERLAYMHHVALTVTDISSAIAWYRQRFACRVLYQDATWGFLQFSNINLALVTPGEHPSHIAFATTLQQVAAAGPVQLHRDGTRSTYIGDGQGNRVELLQDPCLR